MKSINGKLGAIVVAATISVASLFAPSTARATEPALNGFITTNTDTTTVVLRYLVWRALWNFTYALQQHLGNGFLYDVGIPGGSGGYQRSDASGSFGKGMAAGSIFGLGEDVSFWGSGSHTSSDNDFAATAFDSDTKSASFGGDVRVDDIATLGAFVSVSNTDTTSSFNNGGSDTDTVSFGPYVSATVNDNVYVDASFGFLFLDTDNRRTPAGTVVPITGGQRGTGLFGSANLNYSRWMENVNFNGRVGLSGTNVRNDNYTDSTGVAVAGSNSPSAQLQLEAQASYFFENFAPFLRVGYNVEASRDLATAPGTVQPANDKDEFVVGGGVNLFGLGPVTGGINYSRTLGRAEFDSWTVTGQLSIALGGS